MSLASTILVGLTLTVLSSAVNKLQQISANLSKSQQEHEKNSWKLQELNPAPLYLKCLRGKHDVNRFKFIWCSFKFFRNFVLDTNFFLVPGENYCGPKLTLLNCSALTDRFKTSFLASKARNFILIKNDPLHTSSTS